MGAKALLSALKQEHGIRLYRPTAFHDDEDDMDFEKRRMFVLQSERDFKIALDQIGGCIRHRGRTSLTIVFCVLCTCYLFTVLFVCLTLVLVHILFFLCTFGAFSPILPLSCVHNVYNIAFVPTFFAVPNIILL